VNPLEENVKLKSQRKRKTREILRSSDTLGNLLTKLESLLPSPRVVFPLLPQRASLMTKRLVENIFQFHEMEKAQLFRRLSRRLP
jgi:hypothetical protein